MGDVNSIESRPAPRSAVPAPAGAFGPLAVEVSGWMVMYALIALAFGIAGVAGFARVLEPDSAPLIAEAFATGTFDLRRGAAALLITFVLAAAGVFLPQSTANRLSTPLSRALLAGSSAGAAVSAALVFFFPAVWLIWLTALLLGVSVALLVLQAPHQHRKPWRTAGTAAVLLLLTTYAFQIVGGVGAGMSGVRWFLVAGAVLLAASAIVVMLAPRSPVGDPSTGAFPRNLSGPGLRAPEVIARPWACHLLFGVLGAVLALAQPAVADHRFGQAGFAVIICAALLGWAVGFEVGPTFAPGMSRPRLTSLALIGAGVLTLALAIIEELSGKAVLTALVAFAVGVGVRAQNYDASRRMGVGVGVVLALLLCLIDVDTEVQLSAHASWGISATTVAYAVIGLAALVGGIIALFTFAPHGIQGLGVDLVHAFRTTALAGDHRAGAGGAPATGDLARQTSEHLGGPGFFIAVEGGDGSGKTTQIRLLDEHLRARGHGAVVLTREPGGTEAGQAIRSVLLGGTGVAARSEALLFAADRAHHVSSLVRPALERGDIVITDRYIDSSLGYQSAGRELSTEDIAGLSRWATEGLVPHLTLVLDIDSEVAARRTAERGEENHLDREDLAFRQRVQEAFLSIAAREPSRYAVIDANRDPAAVAADVAAAVDAHLAGFNPNAPRPDAGRGARAASGVLPGASSSEPRVAGSSEQPGGASAERMDAPRAESSAGSVAGAPGTVAAGPHPGGPTNGPTGSTAPAAGAAAPADEAATTVIPSASGAPASEAETTVIPPARSAPADEVATTVIPPAGRAPAGQGETAVAPPSHHARGVDEDAETTVLGRPAAGEESAPGDRTPAAGAAPASVPPAGSATNPDPGEAETTVLPPVMPGAPGAAAGTAESAHPAVGEDDPTTVLPARHANRSPGTGPDHGRAAPAWDLAETRSDAAPGAPPDADRAVDPSPEHAREISIAQAHQRVNRDRLVAQAEIERQARERLRQSRLRRSGREKPRDDLTGRPGPGRPRGSQPRGGDPRIGDPRGDRGPGTPGGAR